MSKIAVIDFRDRQFRRDIERVYRHGPRVLAELLAELGERRLIRTEIEQIVARYSRLDPAALDAAGGRGWPP